MTTAGLDRIYLYDDPDAAGLDIDYLAHWLAHQLPEAEIGVRADFLTFHLARFSEAEREELVAVLCRQLEGAQVTNLVRPRDRERLPELAPEDRGLDVVYEAAALQTVLRLLLPPEEAQAGHPHLVFTAAYLGNWQEDEAYLRLRATALGVPSLISTSGLVEALQLPRQYHFLRQQLAIAGIEEEVDDLFAADTIGHGDPRLNEVCKGYVLQALFCHMTGETGCADASCRLHVAATHAETVETQVRRSAGLCERHRELFERWGGQLE